MSISGPCLWLSSPPILSHITAVTAPSSTVAGSERLLRQKPNLVPSTSIRSLKQGYCPNEPIEMQQAAPKAGNALPGEGSTEKSVRPQHTGDKARLPKDAEKANLKSESDTSLSRIRLHKLNCSEPLLSASRDIHSPGVLTPDSAGERRDGALDIVKEQGATTSPSDEGLGSAGAEHQKTPSEIKADKKKMKRFRLTHNQTRFLMSEFTRQAHPDAAHRERLSKEIPGLSPRQVQVWFQNRRAKLKRLTSNDRERVLKSRALPDDFDTTQVLRSPFDGKPTSDAFASPGNYVPSNSDPNSLKMLLTDGLQRPNEDDYIISPLSSASTNGNHFSNTPRKDSGSLSQPGNDNMPERVSELQRNGRGSLPYIRSSSFSEACTHPQSFNTGFHPSHGFPKPGEPLTHRGIEYARRAMDYGGARGGMMVGYEHQQQMEDSVSPTDSQGAPMQHNSDHSHSRYQQPPTMPAPKGYPGMDMNTMPPSSRHMPTLQSIPVSDPAEYRPFAYDNQPPYGMHTTMPFTQPHANASSMSLPASFAPSDTQAQAQAGVYTSGDERMNQPPILTPLRTKFGNPPPFEYANYL